MPWLETYSGSQKKPNGWRLWYFLRKAFRQRCFWYVTAVFKSLWNENIMEMKYVLH